MHALASLSRRKQGFESPRERQGFQQLSDMSVSFPNYLGSFWGINVAKRRRSMPITNVAFLIAQLPYALW